MLRQTPILVAGLILAAAAQRACAQQNSLIGLSDEIIFIARGASKKQQAKQQSRLGAMPGAGENPFVHEPGGRGRGLEQHANPSQSTVKFRSGTGSALSSISAPGPQIVRSSAPLGAPAHPQIKPEEVIPLYGPLELPQGDVEGPPDGLSLDQAIERLVRYNPDLRAKSYEIPQARADVITAGLRGNPFYFLSAGGYPYAPYGPTRPGGTNYNVTVVQPFDLNHKRQARSEAAQAALSVLELQYQNAVRLAIDDLYNVFLDVVVARETIRYAEASLAGSRHLLETAEVQLQAGAITEPDYLNLSNQHEAAAIGLERAQAQYLQAKHALATMLTFPPESAQQLEVRGAIRDTAPPPPAREELIRRAVNYRPDVVAFRRGVVRAQADLRLTRKEVFEDVFFIYSPYETQGNFGAKTATTTSVGMLGTIPLFNRNQGDIRRAQYNVAQTRVGLQAVERQAALEVDRALLEYQATGRTVERLQNVVLPNSERARQGVMELFRKGEKSRIDVLEAQRQHNEFVRQYRDAVISHRRAMLRLNTAVGQRVLP